MTHYDDFIEFPYYEYNSKTNEFIYYNKYIKVKIHKVKNSLFIERKILSKKLLQDYDLNREKDDKKKFKNMNSIVQKKVPLQNNKIEDINLYNNLNKNPPVGLMNIGGICYMNATLQCFFHCKPLTQYFLTKFKKNNFEFSESYYELVKGLSLRKNFNPTKFKKALIKKDESFSGIEGKDSKDVAILLLSELDIELEKKNKSLININKKIDHFNLKEVYDNKIKNTNKSIIKDIFNFYIISEQKCTNECPEYSKTYYNIESDFLIIFYLENMNKYKISLEDWLKSYGSKQNINCLYCNKNTLEVKTSICTLPNIFIFILSRGYNNKFKCKIDFKEEINFNDFKEFYKPLNENEKEYKTKYKLICATFVYDWNEKGKGHTIAFCKSYMRKEYASNSSLYYLFNDSRVISSDFNKIKDETPYLLFYEKQ